MRKSLILSDSSFKPERKPEHGVWMFKEKCILFSVACYNETCQLCDPNLRNHYIKSKKFHWVFDGFFRHQLANLLKSCQYLLWILIQRLRKKTMNLGMVHHRCQRSSEIDPWSFSVLYFILNPWWRHEQILLVDWKFKPLGWRRLGLLFLSIFSSRSLSFRIEIRWEISAVAWKVCHYHIKSFFHWVGNITSNISA